MTLFRWCTLTAVLAAVATTPSHANEDWWFDVEVVAFKRNTALTQLEEQFKLADTFDTPATEVDVISAVVMPDISLIKQNLATCDADGQPQSELPITWPEYPALTVPKHDQDFLAQPVSIAQSGKKAQSETKAQSEERALIDSTAQSDITAQSGISSQSDTTAQSGINNQSDAATSSEQNLVENPAQSPVENALSSPELDSLQPNSTLASADITSIDDIDGVAATNSDYDLSAAEPAPTPQTIASYWASFFGVDSLPAVTTPAFTYCEMSKPWLSVKAQANGYQWQEHVVDNRLPAPKQLPVVIEGNDWPLSASSHLLSSDTHELTSISRQIRSNRALERLLHVAWRQPVNFGKNNAFNVRLFGGINYADQFNVDGNEVEPSSAQSTFMLDDNASQNSQGFLQNEAARNAASNLVSSSEPNLYSGSPSSTSTSAASSSASSLYNTNNDFFAQLDAKLQAPSPITFHELQSLKREDNGEVSSTENGNNEQTPIWEIDGRMKVFLKYINRVPYLHIDSELFYRHPVPETFLSSGIDTPANAEGNTQETTQENTQENAELTPTEPQQLAYQLVSIPLAEQRRVISEQLHYFDHPLFGFIVQIRRYKRPIAEDTQD
ncbi:MAG: hypothetical protein CL600_13975 [Alteromonas sp.]|uniref:CsiV family protein n=1 Tax=Alteromonas sp. MB-3u-76 TaxID=2058133 RepID=UPI000C317FD3|nr:CsiV family protein [Alteromonas sp. MB-3u-76]AUC88812.1 hypothetical protein CW735_11975 [Alteromonas sp. MB-3u-76]MAI65955.1 hypothetical protein [Alteromonas sp.]